MEQENIGKFIHELRKTQGITQKQLAEKIGISDKTVSKWENGNGIPDTGLLLPLCEILGISVNELLSCEKLPPEDYSKKAEENIMDLLKDKEKNNRSSRIPVIIGVVLAILSVLILFGVNVGGFSTIVYFIDIPTLLIIAVICATCVFLSGARTSYDVLKMIQKIVIPIGVFSFFFSVVIILGNISDLSKLGPSLAVAILSVIYSLIIYLIVVTIVSRKEKREK